MIMIVMDDADDDDDYARMDNKMMKIVTAEDAKYVMEKMPLHLQEYFWHFRLRSCVISLMWVFCPMLLKIFKKKPFLK